MEKATQRGRSGCVLGDITKKMKPLFFLSQFVIFGVKWAQYEITIRPMSKAKPLQRIGFHAFSGNRCGIMWLFDAVMIDIKSQKTAPGNPRFSYESSSETRIPASSTMHRYQEGRDMLDMQNYAFRSRIRAET